jgi:hypothetical protein
LARSSMEVTISFPEPAAAAGGMVDKPGQSDTKLS